MHVKQEITIKHKLVEQKGQRQAISRSIKFSSIFQRESAIIQISLFIHSLFVKKFSRKPLSKSCELDPLPAVVLKGCLTVLLPTITRIINLSLSTGVVPDALKVATLLPTLKKSDADFEQFQNFRPISNLKVVSKPYNSQITSWRTT